MTTLAADIELFRRYDLPLPRYTSYPTAPHFTPACGEQQFRRDRGDVESRYEISFDRYFAASLAKLQALVTDELVTIDAQRIRAAPPGRLLLRNIASCFDAYA